MPQNHASADARLAPRDTIGSTKVPTPDKATSQALGLSSCTAAPWLKACQGVAGSGATVGAGVWGDCKLVETGALATHQASHSKYAAHTHGASLATSGAASNQCPLCPMIHTTTA